MLLKGFKGRFAGFVVARFGRFEVRFGRFDRFGRFVVRFDRFGRFEIRFELVDRVLVAVLLDRVAAVFVGPELVFVKLEPP